MFIPGFEIETINIVFILIVLSATAYWLFCVYRFHKILAELSSGSYPYTPGEAVGRHFIPILNFIWLFQWPSAMTSYINERGRVRMISGKLIGLLLLISVLLRFVDGGVGLACTFAVGMYLSAKLRRHIESLKGVSPEMFPPPPNPDLFGYVPAGRTETNPQLEQL
jgi:hypothetical protein